MNILVTGGGGQLGQALARLARAAGHEVRAPARAGLDITDPAAVGEACAWAEAVINAAAYTDVNKAENERDAAFAANATAPGFIAERCQEHGSLLIHVSTDYVFDGGADRPWREDDPTGPLNAYGASKLAGEEAVRRALTRHLIVRTSWVYSETGKNFLLTMLRLGGEREELSIVADQLGTPTSAEDLAAALIDVAEKARTGDGPYGTYHYSAEGVASWADFAETIFQEACRPETGPLLAKAPKVSRIASDAFPTPAKRPAYSVLDCAKIVADYAPPRWPWQAGVRTALSRLAAARRQQEKVDS